MKNLFAKILSACLAVVTSTALFGAGVKIDASSAHEVLKAVQNPSLSKDDAIRAAKLPGNQGLVKKAISYRVPATTESLADELLAAAVGKPLPESVIPAFRFAEIKKNAASLAALLERIERDPERFNNWVLKRVARFSPKELKSDIVGYLVVGGTSGGFAFGREPIFYLNLNYFPEFEAAKVVMAHELYHAVQGVYEPQDSGWWSQPTEPKNTSSTLARQCKETDALFTSLYQEGSATYVGDPLLMDTDEGPQGKKMRQDLKSGIANLSASRTLLEVSVTGLMAAEPVPYDDIYALGFYEPEILYNLGYVLARAIAEDTGESGLAKFLHLPGYVFVSEYLRLPKYGQDLRHPKLGPNVISAVRRLEAGCK